MKNRKSFSLCCALIAVASYSFAATGVGYDDALVNLLVTKAGGGQQTGAGFFTSPDGRILTCYHVIDGARLIKVINRHLRATTDVIVEAIAPDRDLAYIRVIKGGVSVPYMRLNFEPPANFFDEELSILGHPAGITDQRLPARITRPRYALSQEFKDPVSNLSLMALNNVDLLSLGSIGFQGVSGGPLVSSRGVVGVVSGAITTGGSIFWAIPVKYARIEQMQRVDRHPHEIAAWKTLSGNTFLVKGGGLTRRVIVSDALISALDEYFVAVDHAETKLTRLPVLAYDAKAKVTFFRTVVEQLSPRERRKKLDRFDVPGATVFFEEFGKSSRAFKSAAQEFSEALIAAGQRQVKVAQECRLLIERLPQTAENKQLVLEFAQDVERMESEFRKRYESFYQEQASFEAQIPALYAGLKTGDDILNFLRTIEVHFTRWSDAETLTNLNTAITLLRGIGQSVANLSLLQLQAGLRVGPYERLQGPMKLSGLFVEGVEGHFCPKTPRP